MNRQQMIEKMNQAGESGVPFLFVIDFAGNRAIYKELDKSDDSVFFSMPGCAHLPTLEENSQEFSFHKFPIDITRYKAGFDLVKSGIHRGDSFLVNLTYPTRIETNLTLNEIFLRSRAPYRLCIPDHFVCFSPECFVKIENNRISSYPMKGTIDASIPDAESRILNDPKEQAEHYTIVDLIRNDLSRVASKVEVTRFRYIDRVETNGKSLLQVSSEISGVLPEKWHSKLGDILYSMLPAGSVSGAPKDSTVNLIRRAEIDERGFYTGVFGVFDGCNLDSAVIIRYIEKNEQQMLFRSGGGITSLSEAESEYQELIDKVYVSFT